MSEGRALIWVQHLLGIGHLRRAAALARALAEREFDVLLVSGGMPLQGLDLGAAKFEQLPPLRSTDATFSATVDADGREPDSAFRAARRDRLISLYRAHRPQVIITEMYPFGRRQFAAELLPLFEAAHHSRPKPAIFASVRDILTERGDPARNSEMARLALRWYRAVLVHGDPELIPFEASFPEAARISHLIRYTGYIGAVGPGGPYGASGEVVVSAGGGAVGAHLLQTALEARELSVLADRRWRLLAGPNLPTEWFDALKRLAHDGTVVERARSDFPALLEAADLSISQAGYNTVLDVVSARVRSVLVPFAAKGETEQTVRAERMAAAGLAQIVREDGMTPERLAAAVDAAWAAPRPDVNIGVAGAGESARIISESVSL
ncbi:MAG: glycosyltransferase [Proteobacteria bacterium]|nr:glycosyltransferase [Pseudomonadota bacterium]MDA1356567.1 glycosyltransferase [Pseudomonadota bacterium]